MAEALLADSKEFMSGKVLRVVFAHVSRRIQISMIPFPFNFVFLLQFPPAMIIKKEPNGTFTYSGAENMAIDYIASALNLGKI